MIFLSHRWSKSVIYIKGVFNGLYYLKILKTQSVNLLKSAVIQGDVSKVSRIMDLSLDIFFYMTMWFVITLKSTGNQINPV